MKIGEFLVEKNYISKESLDSALILQKDNRNILIGDILITQGIFSKNELLKYVEQYIIETGTVPSRENEWLNQDEIDELVEKYKK